MAIPLAPVPPIEDEKLWKLLARGEELGLRMEATDSGIVWESMPGLRHQELAIAVYGRSHLQVRRVPVNAIEL